MSVYCINDVIKCQGSCCLASGRVKKKLVTRLTKSRLANAYNPNFAAKLNTIFRNIEFAKKPSPPLADEFWNLIWHIGHPIGRLYVV